MPILVPGCYFIFILSLMFVRYLIIHIEIIMREEGENYDKDCAFYFIR